MAAAGGGDQDLDLVERFVGRLFGRQALEDPTPGGLKRLSDDAAKELCEPCTATWLSVGLAVHPSTCLPACLPACCRARRKQRKC